MDYYIRQCRCGNKVKYSDDGTFLTSASMEDGFFLIKRKGLSWHSKRLQATKWRRTVMYCSYGHKLFLNKFIKMDI